VLLLGFAMPPLLQLLLYFFFFLFFFLFFFFFFSFKNVPAVRVIRREAGSAKLGMLAAYAVGFTALAALLVWQAGDLKMGGYVVGGFAAAVFYFSWRHGSRSRPSRIVPVMRRGEKSECPAWSRQSAASWAR